MKVVGALSCAVLAAATLPTKEIVPGVNMPAVNIGTWLAGSKTEDPKVIVANWLGQGFRGVDTALIYNDQADVASAIEESGVPREEIFITTKIPGCAAAAASVNQDLKALNVDSIDVMLIHSPIGVLPKHMEGIGEVRRNGSIEIHRCEQFQRQTDAKGYGRCHSANRRKPN